MVALVGCLACRAEPPPEGALVTSSAANAQPAPARSEPVVVKLGYQKIGTPFLLEARAEPLEQRLAQLQAKVEWVEFAAWPRRSWRGRARAEGRSGLIPKAIRLDEAFLPAAAYTASR
jgi:hypothetical protein